MLLASGLVGPGASLEAAVKPSPRIKKASFDRAVEGPPVCCGMVYLKQRELQWPE